MTEKERYDTILLELAEVLRSKNDEISLLRWQISTLEGKLKDVEELKNDTK